MEPQYRENMAYLLLRKYIEEGNVRQFKMLIDGGIDLRYFSSLYKFEESCVLAVLRCDSDFIMHLSPDHPHWNLRVYHLQMIDCLEKAGYST